MPSSTLQQMLVWATKSDPSITNERVYDPEVWNQIRVRLQDAATNSDKTAFGLLQIFEVLKSHVGSQSDTPSLPRGEEATDPSMDQPAMSSALPLSPLDGTFTASLPVTLLILAS